MAKTPSLLLQFDELFRCFLVVADHTDCEKEFISYVKKQEQFHEKWSEMNAENKRLKTSLDTTNTKLSIMDKKLLEARKLVDCEMTKRKLAEEERDDCKKRVEDVLRLLMNDPRNKLADETIERLSCLSRTTSACTLSSRRNLQAKLDAVNESDCTSSFLSDTSFSRSEDNLDESMSTLFSRKPRRRTSICEQETDTIKRRKSVKIQSFTPTAPTTESFESTSSDEMVSKPEDNLRIPIIQRINGQMHNFVTHNALMRQTCLYCNKKFGFNHTMWKCKSCNAMAHTECIDKVPLPCIHMDTPRKGVMNTISLYAPNTPPMIPAMVVHCVNEIERRGLTEIGIYRISGSAAGVQTLKEKFLKGRGAPNLADESIHNVCSYLKDFLKGLHEPLVPPAEWNTFARAVINVDKKNRLYHAISLLPQPNRDTLAYLILHLQRVATSKYCKVDILTLSRTFASIIVGHSDNEQASALNDAQTSERMLEELFALPDEYWCSLISFTGSCPKTPSCIIRSTPSTESLLKKSSRNLFTPGGRRRFFNTPPLKP